MHAIMNSFQPILAALSPATNGKGHALQLAYLLNLWMPLFRSRVPAEVAASLCCWVATQGVQAQGTPQYLHGIPDYSRHRFRAQLVLFGTSMQYEVFYLSLIHI